MKHIYHDRGFWRAGVRPGLRHLKEWIHDPCYRALHRFHRKLSKLPRRVPAHAMFAGMPIEMVDGASFLSAWDEIFVNRVYDIGDLPEMPLLLDVGANIGLAALYWKRRYGRFSYLGLEPDPRVAECCRRNLAAWSIEGRVVEAAAGSDEGFGKFQPDGADGGRLSREDGSMSVRIVRVSSLMPESVDLLKIDVEGHELAVLQEVGPKLSRVRAIFVEWHTMHGSNGLSEALGILEQAGFTPYFQIAVGPERPFEAVPRDSTFSQHLNIYGVRS